MLYSFIAPTVHQCNTEATKATQNKRNRNHKATEATKAIEPTKAKCQLVKPTNIQKKQTMAYSSCSLITARSL